jgi:uncharacterized protein YndB with AHSA1/START domain
MDATNSPNTEPAERVLVIERVFDAPRSLVFKAWTEPEHMVQWFGPRFHEHHPPERAALGWRLSNPHARA